MDVLKRFLPANFNDLLCLIGMFSIMTIWMLQGRGVVSMPPEIIGATIVTWALLFNFYFRKSPGEGQTK